MATKPSSRPAYQIPPAARLVDRDCDRFEASFRAGQGPRIEDYLVGVDGSCRRILLRELLLLEIELSSKVARSLRPERYRARFPREAEMVDAVFTEAARDLPADLAPGTRPGSRLAPPTIGPYVIVARIGESREEVVYRVLHPELGKEFVLKRARTPLATDPGSAAFLTEEGRRFTELDHPNLVRVVALGHHENHLHLVFENVPGLDLAEHAAQHRYTPRFAAALVADLASAVAYLHDRGLTHQDIQRRNILIDPTGRPRLMVSLPARFRNSTAPSPESDLAGLGALLHDLMTSHPIDRGATPPVPPNPRVSVSKPLEQVCLRALSRDPAIQYPGARDLEKALRVHLRRRVKIAGVLAAFALLLLVSLIAALARSG